MIRKNRYGVEKEFVEINIGSAVIQAPRWMRNPITERRHDLTKLSDDGYLKPFLMLYYNYTRRSDHVVDLDHAPVLTFADEHFEYQEGKDVHIIAKREPASKFEEMVLNG